MVTIYDVAKAAGVSPSTVSRALSSPGRLNALTEARIQQIAQELNFHRNPIARALPTGRTGMLGILVADLTNPMFFDMVRGAEQQAQQGGHSTVLGESQESAAREGAAARRMLAAVDGLILSSSRQSDTEIQDLARIKPVVVVNRIVPRVPSLVPDLAPGIVAALDGLSKAGIREVLYLPGPPESWMNTVREQEIRAAAKTYGLTVTVKEAGEPTLEGGRRALESVVAGGAKATRTQAVIAFNDLMAIGLMQAAIESGINVPAQLSVIGFDDIFGTELTTPQLTTIRLPLRELGEQAVTVLLDLIAGPGGAHNRQESWRGRTELVVRGSAMLEISPSA